MAATFLIAPLAAVACALQWVGNTRITVTDLGTLPNRGGYVEPFQSITVWAETWPIDMGQQVVLIATADRWQTQQEFPLTYHSQSGNNSLWRVQLPALPSGTDLEFYIRATGNSQTRYDNNGFQDFGYYTRFSPNRSAGTILQWFETDYATMLKRLPEVVRAGYTALYLPPPSKGGGGGFSVGYNVVDHFDLGDRLLGSTVRTRYGTAQDLQELIRAAKRFGLEVYCDLVINHNDNRASTAIDRYPNQIPEDFHIRSSSDTGNSEIDFNRESPFSFGMLNHDLLGLADIAHEDGNNTRTGPFNLPPYATFNAFDKPSFVRQPLTPQVYPAGQRVAEDVREYLRRWCRWLVEVIGFDGFRIDAVKHVPPSFFDRVLDQPGSVSSRGDLLPLLYSVSPNVFIFGEAFSTVNYELKEYAKTGMQPLDFPMKGNIDNVFNSSGFGNLGLVFSNGYGIDSGTGLPFEKGGLAAHLGVTFVQSHDQLAPWSNNLASAWLLGRPGVTKVFYDGNNIAPGDTGHFPRPGRFDALGAGSDLLVRLLDARLRGARGTIVNRFVSANLYVFERVVEGAGVLLVGMNIRGDDTPLVQTVQTAFAPGTVLVDASGQRPSVTVDASGLATITVPPNTEPGQPNNGRGYVFYAQAAPEPIGEPIRLFAPSAEEFVFVEEPLPGGTFAAPSSFRVATVTGSKIDLRVHTDASGAAALVMLDAGLPMAGRQPLSGTPEGLADGFVPLDRTGAGTFELNGIDVSSLAEGLHVIRARVFADTGSRPGVFRQFVAFFFVERAKRVPIDGDLAGYGAPLASQTRQPTSNANRLDEMYVRNDDRFLYVGLAGTVSAEERYTNGVTLWLEPTGQGSGIRNLALLNDDSGPAARLLSNSRVTLPTGMSAGFGLGVLRRSRLGTAPEASFVGEAMPPLMVGANAGLYRVDPASLEWLPGVPAIVAWKPRANRTDPATGLETATPLAALFPQGLPESGSVRLVAGLWTTGETGTTLPASNALRGTLGGRPEAISYVTNQFLPTQPNVTGDPGTNAVTLTAFATYAVRRARTLDTPRAVLVGAPKPNGLPSTFTIPIVVRNTGSSPLEGPIHARVRLPHGGTLIGATGSSLIEPGVPYLTLSEAAIPPGGRLETSIEVRLTQDGPVRIDVVTGFGAV